MTGWGRVEGIAGWTAREGGGVGGVRGVDEVVT